MSTSYGKNINITVYGGSHDSEIGVHAVGLPHGFKVDIPELEQFMARRAPGQNAFSTARREADKPIFLSGLDSDGVLDGGTLHAIIKNTNMRPSDYNNLSFIPRPSHADFAARQKYGESVDLRGGGHFSGRLTAPLCIIGGICLQYLRTKGITVGAHIYSIGNVLDTPFDLANVSSEDFDTLKKNVGFPVLDSSKGEQMQAEIDAARLDGDSVGGVIECAALGLCAGLGEHMFDGVENRISAAAFGVPAVKGIEFGNGFECSRLRGSQNNDAFVTDGSTIRTRTNNCGGILGGMSNGMPLVFRVAIKPTPSIYKEQDSVDTVSMTNVKLGIKGRHDPCIVPRAVPVIEAVTAIVLYDLIRDN